MIQFKPLKNKIFNITFTAQTEISDACKEVVEFASKYSVTLYADFNGVKFLVDRYSTPKELVDLWYEQYYKNKEGKMEKRFTIEEIQKYILSQDSMGDIAYNLSEENIIKANEKNEEEEE